MLPAHLCQGDCQVVPGAVLGGHAARLELLRGGGGASRYTPGVVCVCVWCGGGRGRGGGGGSRYTTWAPGLGVASELGGFRVLGVRGHE